jgi:FkbM family methyltransferase
VFRRSTAALHRLNTEDADDKERLSQMEYMRLPNGLRIAHVNAGETGLLYRRIFTDQSYFRSGITLNPGDVVLDVGANIGMASLFFSLQCPGLAIYSFEPAPEPFAALVENAKLFGTRDACRRVALWESRGACEFSYYPNATLMSGIYADAESDSALTRDFLRHSGLGIRDIDEMLERRYERKTFFSEASTLSYELAALRVGQVDLLKLDVEKSELRVLRGIDDQDWPRFKQVAAEVHDIDDGLLEFSNVLRGHGFDVAVEQDQYLAGTDVYTVYGIRPIAR